MALEIGSRLGHYDVIALISSRMSRRLGMLLKVVATIACGDGLSAQTYHEAAFPGTHLRLLRSSYGRQAECLG